MLNISGTCDNVSHRLDWRRLLLAFAIAPLVPSLLAAEPWLFDDRDFSSYMRIVSLFALVGGYPAALLFGLPALLILRLLINVTPAAYSILLDF